MRKWDYVITISGRANLVVPVVYSPRGRNSGLLLSSSSLVRFRLPLPSQKLLNDLISLLFFHHRFNWVSGDIAEGISVKWGDYIYQDITEGISVKWINYIYQDITEGVSVKWMNYIYQDIAEGIWVKWINYIYQDITEGDWGDYTYYWGELSQMDE